MLLFWWVEVNSLTIKEFRLTMFEYRKIIGLKVEKMSQELEKITQFILFTKY